MLKPPYPRQNHLELEVSGHCRKTAKGKLSEYLHRPVITVRQSEHLISENKSSIPPCKREITQQTILELLIHYNCLVKETTLCSAHTTDVLCVHTHHCRGQDNPPTSFTSTNTQSHLCPVVAGTSRQVRTVRPKSNLEFILKPRTSHCPSFQHQTSEKQSEKKLCKDWIVSRVTLSFLSSKTVNAWGSS